MNVIQSFGFIILILLSPVVVNTLNELGPNSIEHRSEFVFMLLASMLVLLGAYYDSHK